MPAFDDSTAEKAAITYCAAMRFADWASLQKVIVATPAELHLYEARCQALSAERALEQAALDKFGPQRERLSDFFVWSGVYGALINAVAANQMAVDRTDDICSISIVLSATDVPDSIASKQTIEIRLIKIQGRWKVLPLDFDRADSEKLSLYNKEKQTFSKVAAAILSGELPTFDAAHRAVYPAAVGQATQPAGVGAVTTITSDGGKVRIEKNGATIEATRIEFKDVQPVVTSALK